MTICILGGGGVFGLHLAHYLLDLKLCDRILAIGRSPLRPAPFTLGLESDSRFVYHARHIGYELDNVLEILDHEKPVIIVNFAAQGEGAISWKQSWRFFETNCVSLSRLVESLSARSWLSRFVHIGTSELYGSVDQPVSETAPIRPTSPYSASKAAFDWHLLSVNRVLGFPATIVRPSNCYAPGQLLHRLIPRAVVCGLTGQKLPLQGGGLARKSYMHARDLAVVIYRLANHPDAVGRVYNVGPSEPTTIKWIVAMVAIKLGMHFNDLCDIVEARPGEDSCYWLDSSAARSLTGWKPYIGLEEGIAEMVAWGRKYIDVLRSWPHIYELRA